jgi:biofilm PGA synthesis N-glycosyltransferase PgaC
MMFALISVIFWIYVLIIVVAIFGWTYKSSSKTNATPAFVSIIIPFRNEEKHLKSVISSVLKNDTSQYELILVNDHSEDNSLQICKDFESKNINIRVLSLINNVGKKAAIKLGIENSKAEIILQTDADCIVGNDWVSAMQEAFVERIKLLIGPVKVGKSNGRWNWFNQLEFAYLQCFTAASANLNKPIMANGANLMYSKEVFWEYERSNIGKQFASGDDQFLLEYVKINYSRAINFVKQGNAIVSTAFPEQWKQMVQQRSRWASKNINTKGFQNLVGALLLSTQLILPGCFIISFFDSQFIDLFWELFILKSALEIILGSVFLSFFKLRISIYVPIFSIIYPFFLLNVLLLGKIEKSYWKGRRY